MLTGQEFDALAKALGRNNMQGLLLQKGSEVPALLAERIAPGASVGCGDSVTLEQTGAFAFLRRGGYRFLDKHRPGLTPEEKRQIYLQNFCADCFVSGANAVTMKGEIFNIDGNGSRVAPMLYGPPQVILVVGANKIVPDVGAAIQRVRNVAAPLDAQRLGKQTPCTKLGHCTDCRHEGRICNDFVLIARQLQKGRITVVVVNEDLGY